VGPLAIVRIPLAYVTGPPPSTRPVVKRGLAASTDVPVITAAPTRDEHDFRASHGPVSFDRPHEQDREVQATTPLPTHGRAERPRATADDDGPRGEKAQHVADRLQILPARRSPRATSCGTLPVRHLGPDSTHSKPVHG